MGHTVDWASTVGTVCGGLDRPGLTSAGPLSSTSPPFSAVRPGPPAVFKRALTASCRLNCTTIPLPRTCCPRLLPAHLPLRLRLLCFPSLQSSLHLPRLYTMASGYYFAPEDPRRAGMGRPMPPSAMFVRDGTAPVASGGVWPMSQGLVPSHPAWSAHATAAFAGVSAGGAHSSGQVCPPVQSLPPSGPPSTPPAGPSEAPATRSRKGRRTRATNARPRSASPSLPAAVGAAQPDSGAPSDGDEEELTVSDVLTAVKRSFATVRGSLTEQRATTSDLGRQVAAGMTKIDRLAVAVEQIAATRSQDQAHLTQLEKKLDDIIERLAADGGDGETSQPAVEPHGWAGAVRLRCLWPCGCSAVESWCGRGARGCTWMWAD